MLVVDGHGIPLGYQLAGANKAEMRLAELTLSTIEGTHSR
jgi:hypothetical protein